MNLSYLSFDVTIIVFDMTASDFRSSLRLVGLDVLTLSLVDRRQIPMICQPFGPLDGASSAPVRERCFT